LFKHKVYGYDLWIRFKVMIKDKFKVCVKDQVFIRFTNMVSG